MTTTKRKKKAPVKAVKAYCVVSKYGELYPATCRMSKLSLEHYCTPEVGERIIPVLITEITSRKV